VVRGRRSNPSPSVSLLNEKGGVDWDLLSCVGSNPPFVPNPKARVPDEAASTIQPIDGSPSHQSKNHPSVDPTGWRWETKGGLEPSQKEPPTTVRAGGRRGEGGRTRPDQTWVWRIAPGVPCLQPEGLGLGIVPRRKETEEEERIPSQLHRIRPRSIPNIPIHPSIEVGACGGMGKRIPNPSFFSKLLGHPAFFECKRLKHAQW